jgi:hypothetical protein
MVDLLYFGVDFGTQRHQTNLRGADTHELRDASIVDFYFIPHSASPIAVDSHCGRSMETE